MTKVKIIFALVLSFSSYSFGASYVCGAHRSPALKCGGQSYPDLIAPLNIQTDTLAPGQTLGNYAAMALPLSDINSPCEDPGAYKEIPTYSFSVEKTKKNLLKITTLEMLTASQTGSSTVVIHTTSAPIGVATLKTPDFKDSVVGKVTMSYECRLSGGELQK